ncbi:TonB family protein [Hymenobacter endophyticus]|uniref:TonB family protein n=1 Tax=Hymenobacter endophyticus TaxID=3076335 RepID=A0ABU3THP7_9BACT|nr:TonB family protein [Hymenobacter endophyticus]MDU0370903.1 TonB family protein [Hymenobacter endophyticus]
MTTAAHTALPSLDDIVFEGRNKAYGAYVLRQEYGQHIRKATIIGVSLAALLLAVPVVIQQIWPAAPPVVDIPADLPIVELLDNVTIEPTSPPAAAVRPTIVVTPPRTFPTRVVPDEQVPATQSEEQVTAPVVDGPVAVGTIPQEGTGGVAGTGTSTGNDSAAKTAEPAVMKPFVHVEEMPEFAGGQAALMKYLQRQLRYPSSALRAGVEGKVFISFTVNTDGTIQDVTVLKGLGYGTDEEASRVIRQMPAWKPGYQNHRAVPVRYSLPITFKYE